MMRSEMYDNSELRHTHYISLLQTKETTAVQLSD